MKSYVYFISNGIHTKIGKANNVQQRLGELQVGSSQDLKVFKELK